MRKHQKGKYMVQAGGVSKVLSPEQEQYIAELRNHHPRLPSSNSHIYKQVFPLEAGFLYTSHHPQGFV